MDDYREDEQFSSVSDMVLWVMSEKPARPIAARVVMENDCKVTTRTVDGWLDRGQITSASVAFSKDNAGAPLEEFSSDFHVQGRSWPFLVSAGRARDLVSKGYSLVLSGPELWDPNLRQLSFAVAESSLCSLNTMIFLAPPGVTGFFPHRDIDDYVVCVQSEGSKFWRLYDAAPSGWNDHDEDRPGPGSLSAELELTEGDVLIIPRGWGHAASAGERWSVHLSLGVNRVDVAHIYRLALIAELRQLPAGASWEQTTKVVAEIEQELGDCDHDEVLRDFVLAPFRDWDSKLDAGT